MRVEKQSTIRASSLDVWNQLWNVQKLIRYIPGVEDVQCLEEGRHYAVRVGDKVGPFQVSFNLDILVDSNEQGRSIQVKVSGKDGRFASTLHQVIDIQLTDAAPGATDLAIITEISILGKLGSLGDALIRTKATAALANFLENLRNDIEAGQGTLSVELADLSGL